MTPYYDRNGIKIYCADNADVLPLLSGVDLIITSPPYNLGVSSGGGLAGATNTGKWKNARLAFGYQGFNDAMSPDKYIDWQHSFLRAAWQTLTPTGAIFYNHKPRIQAGILQTPFELNPGLPLRQIIIWKRAGGVNFSPAHYLPTHEWIMILAKPDFRLKSQGASGAGDVWDFPQESNNPHPAPFPVGLPARAIETTNATLICDPFMGSGTTLRAAQDAGKQAIGVELSEEYCKMAVERLRQFSLFSFAAA
jgi:site-specific DNA-methyltransferase (adenine-specific)